MVTAAVVQYRQSMVDAFEQQSAMLRMTTTKETVRNGNQATFVVNGAGSDTAVTRGVNGQIPYGSPTNTQKTITLTEKHAPYELTDFNVFASQGDQLAGMRKHSMSVINREIDLTILATLASATIDTGAGQIASGALVQACIAELGANDVDVSDENNLFAVISPSFRGYLAQTTEFTNGDYVPMQYLGGPVRKIWRWSGVNWIVSSRITGLQGSTELCYMWHRDALGYAINLGEDSIDVGYDAKQKTSWSNATVYHGGVILQNTGIVQMVHDGSAHQFA